MKIVITKKGKGSGNFTAAYALDIPGKTLCSCNFVGILKHQPQVQKSPSAGKYLIDVSLASKTHFTNIEIGNDPYSMKALEDFQKGKYFIAKNTAIDFKDRLYLVVSIPRKLASAEANKT